MAWQEQDVIRPGEDGTGQRMQRSLQFSVVLGVPRAAREDGIAHKRPAEGTPLL